MQPKQHSRLGKKCLTTCVAGHCVSPVVTHNVSRVPSGVTALVAKNHNEVHLRRWMRWLPIATLKSSEEYAEGGHCAEISHCARKVALRA